MKEEVLVEWGGNAGRWRDAVKWVQRLGNKGFCWGEEEEKKRGAGRCACVNSGFDGCGVV